MYTTVHWRRPYFFTIQYNIFIFSSIIENFFMVRDDDRVLRIMKNCLCILLNEEHALLKSTGPLSILLLIRFIPAIELHVHNSLTRIKWFSN